MDRRQKKRILIFLFVPLLATVLFITDDLIIRVITIGLMVVYVAFIIFLRDSIKFEGPYVSKALKDEDEPESSEVETDGEFGESFEIISK